MSLDESLCARQRFSDKILRCMMAARLETQTARQAPAESRCRYEQAAETWYLSTLHKISGGRLYETRNLDSISLALESQRNRIVGSKWGWGTVPSSARQRVCSAVWVFSEASEEWPSQFPSWQSIHHHWTSSHIGNQFIDWVLWSYFRWGARRAH